VLLRRAGALESGMFTGLVQAVGEVRGVDPVEEGVRLWIDPNGWSPGAGRGGSVAVNGCCLTMTDDPGEEGLAFVAIPETLAKTNLGRLEPGSRVNLETAVSAATLLGGHFVQGHIDGVGIVQRVVRPGDGPGGEWRVRLSPPAGLMRYMTPKGSVCLDGVSLTIAAIEPGEVDGSEGWIEVALIPETLEKTTLADWSVGDPVNIEADVLAKTVVHVLTHYAGPGGLHAGEGAG